MNTFKSIFTVVIVALTLINCGGGGGGADSASGVVSDNQETVVDRGAVPIITDVEMLRYGQPLNVFVGNPGEQLVALISFDDPDLDIETLYIDMYYEGDNYSTVREQLIMDVPEADNAEFTNLFSNDPYIIQDNIGIWYVHFYVVDSAGNESEEYVIQFLVVAE